MKYGCRICLYKVVGLYNGPVQNQTPLLQVPTPMHRSVLKFECCNTYLGSVHQGVALGGSDKMRLRLWVVTYLVFNIFNVLLNFDVYKPFIYSFCLITDFL